MGDLRRAGRLDPTLANGGIDNVSVWVTRR